MKQPLSPETAQAKVTAKYHKLYPILIELVNALQYLEPGGTLVDDVTIVKKEGSRIRVAYVAKPIMLTIQDEHRVFILRVVEAGE